LAETPKRRRQVPNTSERLGRMLVIVPYLVQHPGTSLKDASELFSVAEDQLRRDLDLLFMSGLPPYGPGDLIDVEVDEDGQVWIRMADHFSRPLRMTRSEALALYLRGTELVATPGLPEASALSSALQKLRETLGPETLGEAENRIEISGAAAYSVPEHLEMLRRAAADHRRLQIEYFAHSSGSWSERTIEPEEVFWSLGNWYVAAWDAATDQERLFRADRVRSANETGESFEPRGLQGAGRDLYTPSETDLPIRLRLWPEARWVAEYYATVDPRETDDGALEVTIPARRLEWVGALLLRLGSSAEVLEPIELKKTVSDLAQRTFVLYRS
jgi:proteasome accessory factor C